MVVKFEVE